MKNQLLLIITLFLVGKNLKSQDVTFSFANAQISNDGVNDYYEADVMIESAEGFQLGSGALYFNYNTAAFGESIATDSMIEITYPQYSYLLGERLWSFLEIYSNFNTSDNTASRVSFSWQGYLSAEAIYQNNSIENPAGNNIIATPRELFHIKIKYLDVTKSPDLCFESNDSFVDQIYTACNSIDGLWGPGDCNVYPGTQITNDNYDCFEAGVDTPNVIEQNYSHEWTNGLFDHILPNGLAITDITDPFNSITEYSRGVAVDQNGNSIVTGLMHGKFYDVSTFEEVYETNGNTIFLQKKDPNGNVLWSNYIDGGNYQIPSAGRISNDIAVDSQNNIFICGRINDTTDFDTGPGEFIVVPQTYFSGFIAKYSENGELDFVYLLEGGTDAEPRDIAVDNAGNILVAGIYEATVDFDAGLGIQTSSSHSSMDDNFLLKIDNSGQYIWHKTWGGQQPDDTEGLEIDDAGNSFVACQFVTPVDTDPGPDENILETGPAVPGAGIISNSYVSKFDVAGNLMWSAHFKSSYNNHLGDLATDGENVCVVGINEGDLEIGHSGSMAMVSGVTPSPNRYFYAAKLNSSGEFMWNYSPQQLESPISSYGEEVTSYNGEWYVKYNVSDTADLDNGPSVDTVFSVFTAQYIVKLSEDGMYQWNKKFEMDANGFLELHEIQVTEENMYIVGHYSDGSLDTNPDPNETDMQPSWFKNTLVLIKLSDTTANFEENHSYEEIQKITSTERNTDDRFGNALAISGDYAIIAAHFDDEDENNSNFVANSGSAFIYKYDSENWIEVQKIVAPDRAPFEFYGTTVDIEGETIAFTGPLDGDDETGGSWIQYAGSVNMYNRDSSGIWYHAQKIVAGDRAETDIFGHDVSISGDYLAISALGTDLNQTGTEAVENSGGVYIYEKDNSGVWNFHQKIVASDRDVDDFFGVSLHLNGNKLIVGVPDEDHNESGTEFIDEAGSAYIFERDPQGVWHEKQKIVASDRESEDRFGDDVHIENDYLVVGASNSNKDENGETFLNDAGAVYVFKKDENGIWQQHQKIVSSQRSTNARFGGRLALDDNQLVVSSVYEEEDENGANALGQAGLIHVYQLNQSGFWVEKVKLSSSDRAAHDRFGYDVAIDNGKILSSSVDEDEDEFGMNFMSSSGSVYFFEDLTPCLSTFDTIAEMACENYTSPSGAYEWNASGIYLDTLINLEGCDSIVTVDLTILQPSEVTDVQAACNEFTWIDGNTYTQSTDSALFNIQGGASNGCDSIVTLDLTILQPSEGIDVQIACNNFTWIDGITYTESTDDASFTIVGGATNGCDSVVFLDLTINTVNTNISVNNATISSDAVGANYQWLDCENNMSMIPDETNREYTPNSSGNYAVEITENGCVDTSDCVAIILTSVVQNSIADKFSISPNPTNGSFTIDFNRIRGRLTIRLFSVSRQLIEMFHVQNSDHINLDINYPSGLYFIEIEDSEGRKSILKLVNN